MKSVFAWGLAALSVTALPLQAALPPCAADRLVEEATDVIQITIIDLQEAAAGEMDCTVTGTIAAVLRGEMAVGDTITALYHCESLEGFVGPQTYTRVEDMRVAPWAELHLTDGKIAGYGLGLALPPVGVTGDEKAGEDWAIGKMIWEPDAMCV